MTNLSSNLSETSRNSESTSGADSASPIRVLVIDDEKPVRLAIRAALKSEGMETALAESAEEARRLLASGSFDVLLLDVLMPGADGFSLLQELRKSSNFTPVIVLSGLLEDSSIVKGYGLGADDYITKPFSKAVLVSKIRALTRRRREYSNPTAVLRSEIVCGELLLRLDTQTAFLNGREISLSPREFSLLCKLAERPGEVISKEQLYQEVWNSDRCDNAKMLVYIKRLRDKLEDDPSSPKHLLTDWGKGYHYVP